MIRRLAIALLSLIWLAGLQSLESGSFAPLGMAFADDGGDDDDDGGEGDDSGDDGDDGAGRGGGGGRSGWLNFESRRVVRRRAARPPVRREIIAAGLTPAAIERSLAASARDLGAPGRDPIYGWGLIQYAGIPRCR